MNFGGGALKCERDGAEEHFAEQLLVLAASLLWLRKTKKGGGGGGRKNEKRGWRNVCED